jgi:glycosyltransferase involved in cell wall biosynthesis
VIAYVEGLAEILIALLKDPKQCQILGEAGHRLAMARFSWERVGVLMKHHIDLHLRAGA